MVITGVFLLAVATLIGRRELRVHGARTRRSNTFATPPAPAVSSVVRSKIIK